MVRARPASTPQRWPYWFWPTSVCLPVAVPAVLTGLPERLAKLQDAKVPPPLDIRLSETQEYLFAVFLCPYLVSLWRRLGNRGAA